MPRTEIYEPDLKYVEGITCRTRPTAAVNADEKLRALFGKAQASMFELTKYVSKHLRPALVSRHKGAKRCVTYRSVENISKPQQHLVWYSTTFPSDGGNASLWSSNADVISPGTAASNGAIATIRRRTRAARSSSTT